MPGQEDVVEGGGDESYPPKLALDEGELPPGKSGGDGWERRYAQHHQQARGYGACGGKGGTVKWVCKNLRPINLVSPFPLPFPSRFIYLPLHLSL